MNISSKDQKLIKQITKNKELRQGVLFMGHHWFYDEFIMYI